MAGIKATAAVGGGVIGGAWAARFVFNGFDCRFSKRFCSYEPLVR